MFDRLKQLFDAEDDAAPARGGRAVNDLQLAAAAVLVEAARRDADYDLSERRVIEGLLRERFSLSAEEAERLIEAADAVTDHGVELYTYTRRIKDAFDEDERIRMIEMLWEVVYADGKVDHLEANLLRRVAGLLYVTDRESGEARKRVLDRKGPAS